MSRRFYKGPYKGLRSEFERRIKRQLDEMGVKYEYEGEKIEYRTTVISGICTDCGARRVYQKRKYTPDFTTSTGVRIEVKGRLTSKDRSKLKAVIDQHPGIDLRIVFGSNNKLTKNKEKRYLDWAREMKMPSALKEIPSIWLQDLLPTDSSTP